MSAQLRYFFDRQGNPAPLRVQVTADGPHGAIGAEGVSPSTGFPPARIGADGWLTRDDGAPYGINPDESGRVTYRLTVTRQGLTVHTLTFPPTAVNGVIDVNALQETP